MDNFPFCNDVIHQFIMGLYRDVTILNLKRKGKGNTQGLGSFLREESVVETATISKTASASVKNTSRHYYYIQLGGMYLLAELRVRFGYGVGARGEVIEGIYFKTFKASLGNEGAGKGHLLSFL